MSRRSVAIIAGTVVVLLLQSTPAGGSHAQVELVSGGTGANVQFRGASKAGGRALFIASESLSPADTDSQDDLYRWSGGQPELISIGSAGGNGPFGVGGGEMSADGSHVFFESWERLTADDTDDRYDVYERFAGQTRRVSLGNGNALGDDDAFLLAASDDGTRAFFRTNERLHPHDLDSERDVYERSTDSTFGLTRLVTGRSNAVPEHVTFSRDGSRVLFLTAGRESAADTDAEVDAYLYENGALQLISIGPTGGNGPFDVSRPGPSTFPTFRGLPPSLSHVLFYTDEQLTSDDTDTTRDLYERHRASGTTRLFSDGPSCPAPCPPFEWVASSQDGSATFITTNAALDPADLDSNPDLYRRTSSGYALIPVSEPGSMCCFNEPDGYLASSSNGDRVVFSTANHLTTDDQDVTECQEGQDWYACNDLYQRFGGDTELLSGGPPNPVGFDVRFAGASSDARAVFFYTEDPLVPQDTDTSSDLYMRAAGTTSLVSVGPTGGNGPHHVCRPFSCEPPEDALSDDGNRVFFQTAERLVAADVDNTTDIYMATVASGYPRPLATGLIIASLVPAYRACTAPDRQHGPPLAHPSCSSPDQVSSHLTVGTSDANGEPAKSTGYVRYGVAIGNPNTSADEADVRFYLTLRDVRRADLSDYEGELELRTEIRITDRGSGSAGHEPATVEDLDFTVVVPCAATGDQTIGSRCEVTTTAEAVAPGALTERNRAIWAVEGIRLYDGGSDGLASSQDNTLFAVSGVFVP